MIIIYIENSCAA